jgi:hypothetical protein
MTPENTDTPLMADCPSATCSAVDCSRIIDNGCDSCVAYQMANEQLRADVKRLIVQRNRITDLVTSWRDMPAEEIRLRAGDMTAQEIRSLKAVLNAILPNAKSAATGSERKDHE